MSVTWRDICLRNDETAGKLASKSYNSKQGGLYDFVTCREMITSSKSTCVTRLSRQFNEVTYDTMMKLLEMMANQSDCHLRTDPRCLIF